MIRVQLQITSSGAGLNNSFLKLIYWSHISVCLSMIIRLYYKFIVFAEMCDQEMSFNEFQWEGAIVKRL